MWACPTGSPARRYRSRAWPQLGVGVVEAAQPDVGAGEVAVGAGLGGRVGQPPGGGHRGAPGGGLVVPVPPPVEEVSRVQASCQVWVSNPVAAAWSTAASSTGMFGGEPGQGLLRGRRGVPG